jgi:YbbR domain-containing protein
MKLRFKIDIKSFIFNNFWLKVISLIIAIITWLYVNGELTRGIRI